LVRTLIHQWLAWRMLSVRAGTSDGPDQQLLEEELQLVRTA